MHLAYKCNTKPDWGQPTAVETQGYKPKPGLTNNLTAIYADGKEVNLQNKIVDNNYADSISWEKRLVSNCCIKSC